MRRGGLGRFTFHLMKGLLLKNDVSISMFTVDKDIAYNAPFNDKLGYSFIPQLTSPILSKLLTLFAISVRNPDVDLLHCNYVSNAAFLPRYDGQILLTMHGFPRPEVEPKLADKLAYSFEQFCAHLIPKKVTIVTISKFSSEMIKKKYRLDTKLIYNGIDCQVYKPSSNRDSLRQVRGYQNTKLVAFIGRFHPQKDPVTLVKAYLIASKKVSNLKLIMVGSGPLMDTISSLSKGSDGIQIFQNIDDENLIALYQSADLLVYPSIGEPFGLILVEAMACGCPCIATSSGAAPEILGRRDILCEPHNPEDMAEKMINLLQNPSYSKEVSNYLNEKANECFRIEQMIDKYYNLYRSLI